MRHLLCTAAAAAAVAVSSGFALAQTVPAIPACDPGAPPVPVADLAPTLEVQGIGADDVDLMLEAEQLCVQADGDLLITKEATASEDTSVEADETGTPDDDDHPEVPDESDLEPEEPEES